MAKDLPEVNDVLIGTVESLINTSVFVKLKDYNYSGVIIFSEVAPGRIRNIRDYVKPGQKIAVKVIRIDKEKKNIDLSLRRVSPKEKKQVLEQESRERELGFLLPFVIQDQEKQKKVIEKIRELGVVDFFEEALKKEAGAVNLLVQSGLSEKESKVLVEKIREKIKVKKVQVKAKINLKCPAMDGIEKIKKVLDVREGNISYLSAPSYSITVENTDYKNANKKMESILQELEKRAKQESCEFEVIKK
jgi:translation initiation factor 2 subunit 1